MSHSRYLFFIGLAGFLACLGFFLVLTRLDPYSHMGISLSLFFATFFIAVSATFTVFGFYFRVWLFRNEVFYKHINIALRQGVFLAIIAVFCLIFLMLRLLNWWTGLLLIAVIVLLEAYFSSKDGEIIA